MTLSFDEPFQLAMLDVEPIRTLLPEAGGGRAYRFYRSRSKSYWLLPAGSVGRVAAAWLHSPQSPGGRLLNRAMTLGIPLAPSVRLDPAAVEALTNKLRDLTGCPRGQLAFMVGPPRPANRLTAVVIGPEGLPAGFAKIAPVAAAVTRLGHEADTLEALAKVPELRGRMPVVLGRFIWRDQLGIALSPGPEAPGPKFIGPEHRTFLETLRNVTADFATFAECATGRAIREAANGESLKPEERDRFRQTLRQLKSIFGSSRLPTMRVHGDFVPWNTRRAVDGRLWVLDWEESRQDLLSTDPLHFDFLPATLKRGNRKSTFRVPDLVHRLWPESESAIEGLQLAYLGGLAWRYSRLRSDDERASSPVLGETYDRMDALLGRKVE